MKKSNSYSSFPVAIYNNAGSLEILEYCNPSLLLEREKWYFGLLLPEYNLAKEPGSPISGRTHTEETLAEMSPAHLGTKRSPPPP